MESISSSDYKKAQSFVLKNYTRGNKPMLACEFMEPATKNNPACLKYSAYSLDWNILDL
jgi:hypothetical protein